MVARANGDLGSVKINPVFREDPHFHSLCERPEFLSLMAELKREWEGYRQEFGRH